MKLKMTLILLWLCGMYLKILAQEILMVPSNDIHCLSTLHIDKFEFKKKWKVVVGEPIDYKAKPNSGEPNWSWELGVNSCTESGGFWNLQNLLPPFTAGKNKGAKITNMPVNNSDFGQTHGLVKVSNDWAHSCKDSKSKDAKVQVFFNKDDKNNPDGTVPNWFYYWRDEALKNNMHQSEGMKFFIPDPTDNSGVSGSWSVGRNPVSFNLLYDDTGAFKWVPPPATIAWGANHASSNIGNASYYYNSDPSAPIGARKRMTGYNNINFSITFGEGCGYEYHSIRPINIDTSHNLFTHTIYRAIEGFVAVIYHEMEHWKIFDEFWKDGYDNLLDLDGDFFPDAWESSDGLIYGFSEDPDIYNVNYKSDSLHIAGASAMYQEVMCRLKEVSSNTQILNPVDWSYDPKEKYQGKNWK